jgi:hypothetical protein
MKTESFGHFLLTLLPSPWCQVYLVSAVWALGGALLTLAFLPDTTGLDITECAWARESEKTAFCLLPDAKSLEGLGGLNARLGIHEQHPRLDGGVCHAQPFS